MDYNAVESGTNVGNNIVKSETSSMQIKYSFKMVQTHLCQTSYTHFDKYRFQRQWEKNAYLPKYNFKK